MISGLLLAAGTGRRFGGQKLLETVDGMPIVSRVASACLDSRLDELVAVTGPDERVAGELQARFQGYCTTSCLHIVTNADPERGLMSSLKTGLASIAAGGASAAMVIHGDMPLVSSRIVDQLVLEFNWHGGIIVPVADGQWRHPRVIPRSLFEEFLALADDASGTEVIERYRPDVTLVEFDQPQVFVDVDAPADLDAVNSTFKPRPS